MGFNRLYFVYIDLKTGNQTKAFYPAIEDFSYTYTGMMYDPSKRAYYWNYFTKDHKSHMALVEDPAAPMKPAFGEMDFPQGALSGNVSFTMPEKTNGGEALTGDLQWILSVDGNDVASGSGKPGEKVSAPVKDLTTGEHLFSVSVKSGEVYRLHGHCNRHRQRRIVGSRIQQIPHRQASVAPAHPHPRPSAGQPLHSRGHRRKRQRMGIQQRRTRA